ncbi:M24 family metallopeptidase [Intestinibacillus massiliensis]|uniref:M24 family metallopeptidase n=1 Tax=Intestinibacillus massiliensis TaxID=1871029 RepID=UPI000B362DFA|nr:Xaa-Pro peptidase family protein [Intestinibacillus massiliensis]
MADELRRVPKSELDNRLAAFRRGMDALDPGWSMALVNHKINMYYLTGTMQDGVLVIRPDSAILWVRRSYERGRNESLFDDIRPMRSFRTLGEHYGDVPETIYVETKTATLEWIGLVRKYLPFQEFKSVNRVLEDIRSIKSLYEIGCMRLAGRNHAEALEVVAPSLLREGVSEAELAAEIFEALLRMGSHGISRFNQPLGEDVIGFASFGKAALVTTAFDGPGGTDGTCIAVQTIGSAERKLSRGRLVYLDIPSGIEGYHTDKSTVFYFGRLDEDPDGQLIREAYAYCQALESEIASRLVPGAVLEDVYAEVMDKFDVRYIEGFMNGGRFLGHSIGLTMDETPVIARGFKTAVQADMTFAIEPKIALPGIGTVGTENTYLITADGAVSLSGTPQPLREIY